MKTPLLRACLQALILTMLAAVAVATTGCSKKPTPTPEKPIPVITITAQPTAPADVTAGNVTGSMTVEATVTEGATLTYQWYTNTSASNTGGTPISGATSTTYILPTDLTAGTYYYFCEVGAKDAKAVRTSVVTVTVNPKEEPEPGYTYSIGASTLSAFASVTWGYATAPAAQTVTITNNGTGTVMLTQPTTTKYDITLPSPATIPAGQSATVSIRPKTGLAVGTHNETITISGRGASAQVSAQFTVNPKPVTVASVSGVTAPVANVAAMTQTTPGTGFTGAVSWSPALETGGKFGYNTTYTATITLTAAANHIFDTTLGWTVAGAPDNGALATIEISNGGKTLTIKVAYPVTGSGNTGFDGNIGIGDNGTEQDWVNP